MMRRNRKTHGFTLVEVLLVIAILGVLAGVFVFTIGGRPDKAKVDVTTIQVNDIAARLEEYKMAINEYPTEEQGGLSALIDEPTFDDDSLTGKWAGPYIKRKQLKDAWGTELSYELEEEEHGDSTRKVVHVWSHGPNKEDDSGEGDDIKSWEDEEEGGAI
jgi:general secretion pathway protein G